MGDEAIICKCVLGGLLVVGGILVIILPLSFDSIEYYEYGFARQKSTGKVYLDKVYTTGKHFIGPDYEFKKFRADAHFVNVYNIAAFTQDKLEVKLSAAFQYFIRKSDLRLLHQRYDIQYKDVMRTSGVDAMKVKVDAAYQYFLKKRDLGLLHSAYDLHYQDVMRTSGIDAIKGAVTVFNTREMFHNRSDVEDRLFKAVRERLGGVCCPESCKMANETTPPPIVLKGDTTYQDSLCPPDCKRPCLDADKGIYVDVKYFQLGSIEIPDEVENRFLQQLTLTEETLKEQLLQDAQVIRKNTDAEVRRTMNDAGEIRQSAQSKSGLIKVTSEANYTNIIETARSEGLKKLYSNLGITSQEHKNSFDYLRTLRGLDNVHMTVDFQQRIAGNL